MPTVIIKSNPGTTSPILLPDLGYSIPASGGEVQLESLDEITKAADSRSLAVFVVDEVYGGGSSTLILNDGLTDIPQEQALEFLAGVTVPDALDSLAKNIAEDSFDEVVRTGGRITSVITWETPAKIKRIREVAITYEAGRAKVVTEEQYNAGGALKRTLTSTATYSGGLLASVLNEVS